MHRLSRRHLFGAVCGGCVAVQEGFRATPVQAQTAAPAAGAAGRRRARPAPPAAGRNDTIGDMNLLTPQKAQEAARLVTQGADLPLGIVGRTAPPPPSRRAASRSPC